MGLRVVGAPRYAYACVCLIIFLLQVAQSQRNPEAQRKSEQPGSLRQTLQWSHNGKVFSILSQGSEYQPPRRRGAPQEQVRAQPVTIIHDAHVKQDAQSQPVVQQQQQQQQQQPPRSLPQSLVKLLRGQHPPHGRSGEGEGAQESRRANETQEKVSASPPLPRREDMMVGDDPYDPYKSIDSDNPYYNYHDVYERPRPRSRPGYGTSYHQYGKRGTNALKTISESVNGEMLDIKCPV